jgi:hypothetical protein
VTAICKLVKAGQRAKLLARYIAKQASQLFGNLGFGPVEIDPADLAQSAKLLRADHGESRASEVRHLIFSVPKGTEKVEAQKVLKGIAADWLERYAPNRRWLAGFQEHNSIDHLHLAVANVDDAGDPLQLRPHQVKAMASMEFTSWAQPAQGIGAPGVPVYPHAPKLAVAKLAKLLPKEGELADLVLAHPEVEAPRTRQDGSLVSFAFRGKRVRLSTLQKFLHRLPAAADDDDGSHDLSVMLEAVLSAPSPRPPTPSRPTPGINPPSL